MRPHAMSHAIANKEIRIEYLRYLSNLFIYVAAPSLLLLLLLVGAAAAGGDGAIIALVYRSSQSREEIDSS